MKRAIPYNTLWPAMTLWVVFTGGALWWGAWWTFENYLFADHAQHIQGTVLRKFMTESHGRGGTHYTPHIVYGYQAGNLAGNCETVAHGDTWAEFPEGGPIPIKYLPEEPQNSRIDDAAEDYMALIKARIGVGLGLFSLVTGAAVSAYVIKRNKLQRRLVTTGLSCLGRVTSIETERAGKRWVTYLIFEFTDNRGSVVVGRTWPLNSNQEGVWIAGKMMKGFYDPANSDVFTVDLDQSPAQN